MTKFTQQDILTALAKVIPEEAESVFFLSRLWTFAHRLEVEPHQTAAWLLDLIECFISLQRTLVLPAFTFSYGSTRQFDIVRSRPETGVLNQAAMTRSEFKRTPSPMVSYLVRGPMQQEILSLPFTTTCGDDGVIGWFKSHNTRICTLGIEETNMGWGMIHYAEEMLRVPYRYFKKLPGEYFIDGVPSGECTEVHYVNPLCRKLRHDNTPLNVRLKAKNLVTESETPGLAIKSAAARDIVGASMDLLNNDPLKMIVNRDDARRWIDADKENEIASLDESERWQA